LVWLRFPFFRFEPTCKVLRIFGLRLHQPSHRKFDLPLPTRTELNAKTRPNSGALIEGWGYFRYWHETDMPALLSDVRCWGQSGLPVLGASISRRAHQAAAQRAHFKANRQL